VDSLDLSIILQSLSSNSQNGEDLSDSDIKEKFKDVSEQLISLQNDISAAALYLTPYDRTKAQKVRFFYVEYSHPHSAREIRILMKVVLTTKTRQIHANQQKKYGELLRSEDKNLETTRKSPNASEKSPKSSEKKEIVQNIQKSKSAKICFSSIYR